MKQNTKTTPNRASDVKVRSAINKIIAEEYKKILKEGPAVPLDADASATPVASPTGANKMVSKLVTKINSLPAVQQLVRRVPNLTADKAAAVIMSIIDAMEEKTADSKDRLISRELILLLRAKLQTRA